MPFKKKKKKGNLLAPGLLFEFSCKILDLLGLVGSGGYGCLLLYHMVQGDTRLFGGQLLNSERDVVWLPPVQSFVLAPGR